MDRSPDDKDSEDIRVFTLNCWGLKVISELRQERMKAIGEYLSQGEYDIVLLQEVWASEDFRTIREAVREVYPYSHFFDNGIIGTGTCIFTRTQINDATFHEFTTNGYPHKIWHGDWFGGKGLGVCQIEYKGFDIHIYTSHFHAEYDRSNDVYLGHRVIHALESAQWIKLASSSADLTIYGGDFNTEPVDVPYKLVKRITPLRDAWEEVHGIEGGETCDTPGNSFSRQYSLRDYPEGKRIDYIMYIAGPNIHSETISCSLPLPERIPGQSYSYSDHAAVSATIRIKRNKEITKRPLVYRKMISQQSRVHCVSAVKEALEILRRSHGHVDRDGFYFNILSMILFIVLIISFIPIAILDREHHAYVEISLFIPRFLVTVGIIFFALMGTLFKKKEKNSITSSIATLKLIEDQDLIH